MTELHYIPCFFFYHDVLHENLFIIMKSGDMIICKSLKKKRTPALHTFKKETASFDVLIMFLKIPAQKFDSLFIRNMNSCILRSKEKIL